MQSVEFKGADGFQVDCATNGVGIQVRRQGFIDGHGVEHVRGDAIEHNAPTVLRGRGTDAIDGHGVEIGIHTAHRHVTAFPLIVLYHYAGYAAQRFSHIDVGEVTHCIGVNDTGNFVGLALTFDSIYQGAAAAEHQYVPNFFFVLRGFYLGGDITSQYQPHSHY